MDQKRIDGLLQAMTRLAASALHLVPGRPPLLRVQRRLVRTEEPEVRAEDVDELIRDMLFSDHRERLARRGQVEVLYVARDGARFRAAIAEHDGAHSIVLRPVPASPPRLEALDLPDQVGAFARCRSGLVLVAGFFGSGKSTTLAALVAALAEDPARHVVTIEDAIEFVHPPGAALLHQREVGSHVASAADGIRQSVALGVDTIVVSELHDGEALDAAITAVEAGCLCLCGVEAGSIVGALSELILRAPVEERPRLRTRLARTLRGVTAQNLLQRSHRPGRVAVVEILVANPAARAAIRLGNLQELPGIMQRCRGLGMQTTDLALRGLLARHLITQDEALYHAVDREQVLARTSSQPIALPGR